MTIELEIIYGERWARPKFSQRFHWLVLPHLTACGVRRPAWAFIGAAPFMESQRCSRCQAQFALHIKRVAETLKGAHVQHRVANDPCTCGRCLMIDEAVRRVLKLSVEEAAR